MPNARPFRDALRRSAIQRDVAFTAHAGPWSAFFAWLSEVGLVNGWQALLPIAAAAMGWWRLIRSSGGLVALDRPIVAAGLTREPK